MPLVGNLGGRSATGRTPEVYRRDILDLDIGNAILGTRLGTVDLPEGADP